MTDKQIIDGVDVSRCGHYHYGKCEIDYDEWNNEIIRYNECQNNPNCYYKQLARKEQECDELKEALTEIRKIAEKEVKHAPDGETFARPEIKQILQKISEVGNEN